jgi:hypothetical protein
MLAHCTAKRNGWNFLCREEIIRTEAKNAGNFTWSRSLLEPKAKSAHMVFNRRLIGCRNKWIPQINPVRSRAGQVRADGNGNAVFHTTASYNGFIFSRRSTPPTMSPPTVASPSTFPGPTRSIGLKYRRAAIGQQARVDLHDRHAAGTGRPCSYEKAGRLLQRKEPLEIVRAAP